MLTAPYPVPPNSTSPLPANYGQQQWESIFNLFSAGLMSQPQIACAPGPAAFADLAPAGTMFPRVTPNAQPALSTAVLTPAPVSPLAAQVYQVQEAMRQGLTNGRNEDLTDAVNDAGQSGSSSTPDDWADAAQVFPMSTTTGIVAERTPINRRPSRRGPPRSTDMPGTPWGGAPVNVPGGGCSSGLSDWGKVFFFAGLGVLALAIVSE